MKVRELSMQRFEFKDVYSEGGFRDAINIPSLDERIKLDGKLSSL